MRNESTKVEGKAKNHWLHEISIQNEGSRTKKNESRPKTKDSKIWFQDPKPKPKPITKIQEQGPRVKAKTPRNQDSRTKDYESKTKVTNEESRIKNQ